MAGGPSSKAWRRCWRVSGERKGGGGGGGVVAPVAGVKGGKSEEMKASITMDDPLSSDHKFIICVCGLQEINQKIMGNGGGRKNE